jgi:hypothetical protein
MSKKSAYPYRNIAFVWGIEKSRLRQIDNYFCDAAIEWDRDSRSHCGPRSAIR